MVNTRTHTQQRVKRGGKSWTKWKYENKKIKVKVTCKRNQTVKGITNLFKILEMQCQDAQTEKEK